MPIAAACACGATLKAPDHLAGKSIRCPKCQAVLKVPGGNGAPVGAAKAPVGIAPQAVANRLAQPNAPDAAPARPRAVAPSATLPARYQAEVEDELTTGERILWVGRPRVSLIFWRYSFFLFIGIFLFLGATGYLLYSLFLGGPLDQHGVFGLLPGFVFLGVGTVMTLVPFDCARRARQDVYALTNRRCIVWTKYFFSRTKEVYLPTQLTNLRSQRSLLGGGRGDVVFKTNVTIHIRRKQGGPSTTNRSETHFGFLAIDNYAQVEKMIRENLVDKVMDKLAQLNDIS